VHDPDAAVAILTRPPWARRDAPFSQVAMARRHV
jgi:hypothetical protein